MDIKRQIVDKIEECFNKASISLLESERVNLYLPYSAIRQLEMYNNVLVTPANKLITYRGVNIRVGYEMSVVLVHEDYHIYSSDELISRVNL